jgi:hypothetical protein
VLRTFSVIWEDSNEGELAKYFETTFQDSVFGLTLTGLWKMLFGASSFTLQMTYSFRVSSSAALRYDGQDNEY